MATGAKEADAGSDIGVTTGGDGALSAGGWVTLKPNDDVGAVTVLVAAADAVADGETPLPVLLTIGFMSAAEVSLSE